MKRILFWSVLTLCLYGSALAQQDSLRLANLLNNTRLAMNKDATQGKLYLDSAEAFVTDKTLSNWAAPDYYKLLGIYYYRTSNYDSSLIAYQKSAQLYERQNNPLEQAKILVNTSMVNNRQSNYEAAISNARKALVKFDSLGDTKGVGISTNIIGQVYYYNKEFDRAKKYFHDYLRNALARQDSAEITSGYTNLGGVSTDLKQYDSAIYYHTKSLELAKILKSNYSAGNAYQNLASTFKELGQTPESLVNYDSALHYYKLLNYPAGQLEVYLNLGKSYNNTRQPQQAIPYLQNAVKLADDLDEKFLKAEALESLSLAYENAGDFKNGYSYLKEYKSFSDSIFNIEKSQAIEEINTRYETEKKDNEIRFLSQENDLQKATNQRNLFIIFGLIVLVALLALIFFFWRQRQQARQQKVLQEQKIRMREAQIQAVISSEEKERKRFAADLHDSMGQLVSALNLNIQSLRQHRDDRQVRDEIFNNASHLLGDIQQEIRNIAFNLMPQVLTKEGLIQAMHELVLRINKSHKIKADLQVYDMEGRFAEVYEISLYRILQEWISNVLKYSDASELYIQFTGHPQEVVVTVEDNGMGFELSHFENSKGNGYKNINTRLNLINGTMEIDTQAGRPNNILTISVPSRTLYREPQVAEYTQHQVL